MKMIIYKKDLTSKLYADMAVYCNEHNCHIEDKGDYLESVENEPYVPTIAEKVASYKKQLVETDYIDNKLLEAMIRDDGSFEVLKEQYARTLAEREEIREKIRALENE